MSVGGSLAGEISTWMRMRYPFIVDMALAGSAPVLGFPHLADQYAWCECAPRLPCDCAPCLHTPPPPM